MATTRGPLLWLVLALASVALAAPAHAQHVAGAGHAHAGAAAEDHHAIAQTCASEFEKVVGEGHGFGMAFAADQNGYPGPRHVLELGTRLGLTPEQEARMSELMAAMYDEAKPKSARLLDAERKLRALYADRRADERSVRAAVAEIEEARTQVRLVHLLTHLKTRELLTDEQRRLYHEARWGAH